MSVFRSSFCPLSSPSISVLSSASVFNLASFCAFSRDAELIFEELVSAREIRLLRDRMTSMLKGDNDDDDDDGDDNDEDKRSSFAIFSPNLLNCFQNEFIWKRLKQQQNP